MLTSPDEAIVRALAVVTCDLDLSGPGSATVPFEHHPGAPRATST
jgi:hypothetical protein